MTLTHVYKQNWGNRYFIKPAEISPADAGDLYCALCGHRVLLRGTGESAYFEHEPGQYDCAEKSSWPGANLSMPTPGESFVIRQPERKSRIDNPIVYATSPSPINDSVVFATQQPNSFAAPQQVSSFPQDEPVDEDELLKTEAIDLNNLPGELGMYYAETQAVPGPSEIGQLQAGTPNMPVNMSPAGSSPAWNNSLGSSPQQNAPWNNGLGSSPQQNAPWNNGLGSNPQQNAPWNNETIVDESFKPSPDLQATIIDDDAPLPAFPSRPGTMPQQVSFSDTAKPKVTIISSVPIPKPRNHKANSNRTLLLAISTIVLVVIIMTLILVALIRPSSSEHAAPAIKVQK